MKRQALLEQQQKIKKMFSYIPGNTITENDEMFYSETEEDMNEVAPLAVAGWAVTAAWAGYEIWKWADNTWGSKKDSTRIKVSTDPSTWGNIVKSMKKTSIALGEDISDKMQVLSDSNADTLADYLYNAMDGAGTYENQIRKALDKMGSFTDLAKVAYKFGTREGYTLWGWLDDELSQSYFTTYVVQPMQSKPLLVWDGKQYNNLEEWAVELTKLVDDKAAQPKKDDQNKKTIINALKGKKGSCMEEYLADTVIGYTPKGVPYLIYEDGETKLWVYSNGRFVDAKTNKMGTIQNCDEIVTESVDSILNLNWVLGSLTEQFKVIYDDDKENVVTIKDKEVVTEPVDDSAGEETEKVTKKSKWTLYSSTPDKTPVSVGHYNKDVDSVVKQIQKILGIKEDGYYGKNTKKAVIDWQKENGVKVDGSVGPETWAKMSSTTEVAGEKAVDPVVEKKIEAEVTKVVQDVQQNKVDVPTARVKLVKDVLESDGNKKMQKNYCQNLIAFEAGMLKSNMDKSTDLKALGRCYDNHNFGMGGVSRTVRKSYGLKTSKNNLG